MSPARPTLSLGISPCPNDTFAFDALLHGRVRSPRPLVPILADIEALNAAALRGELDVTKVSVATLFEILDEYALLDAGAALGRGCGPLLVTKMRRVGLGVLHRRRLAIPGERTTAWLLLRLTGRKLGPARSMAFDRCLAAARAGTVDAALIIHELRFTCRWASSWRGAAWGRAAWPRSPARSGPA